MEHHKIEIKLREKNIKIFKLTQAKLLWHRWTWIANISGSDENLKLNLTFSELSQFAESVSIAPLDFLLFPNNFCKKKK